MPPKATTAAVVATLLFGVADGAAAEPPAPTIAIDVGHSLARPGATSARGRSEFEFNRELALDVDRVLRQRGFATRLIGADGDIDKLTERTDRAATAGATFFLSIHHDSVQPQYLETGQLDGQVSQYTDRPSGFSLFVSRSNPDPATSFACARVIGQALRQRGFTPSLHHAEPIRGENRPLADAENGVYYFDDLVVLKTARSPAVLVEAGVIVNRSDEVVLRKASTRQRLAGAIGDGLVTCRKVSSPAR